MRRFKVYPIEISALARLFRGFDGRMHPHYRIGGFPADGHIVGMQVQEGFLDRLLVFVQSETFDEVPEGEAVPEATLTVSRWLCDEYLKLPDSAV